QHIQLGQPGRVAEELRVRLCPFTAAGDRLAADERVGYTGRPVVERRRALVPVGAATTDQPEPAQTLRPVAQRPSRHIGEQPFELGLRELTLLTEQREQSAVEPGQGRERVAPAQPAGAPAAARAYPALAHD